MSSKYETTGHAGFCASLDGIKYACDCGYASRIKDEDTKATLLLVSCRVEYNGRELNPEFPVLADGYDAAIEKVKAMVGYLGLKFQFIHQVRT